MSTGFKTFVMSVLGFVRPINPTNVHLYALALVWGATHFLSPNGTYITTQVDFSVRQSVRL